MHSEIKSQDDKRPVPANMSMIKVQARIVKGICIHTVETKFFQNSLILKPENKRNASVYAAWSSFLLHLFVHDFIRKLKDDVHMSTKEADLWLMSNSQGKLGNGF